jgi:hypothetical protein
MPQTFTHQTSSFKANQLNRAQLCIIAGTQKFSQASRMTWDAKHMADNGDYTSIRTGLCDMNWP